jgi:dolichol-phosphate mannosyltransferase
MDTTRGIRDRPDTVEDRRPEGLTLPPALRKAGLSVVIPVFEEESSVGPLSQEILAALNPLGIASEVIFVDDGSRDDTVPAVQQAMAADSRIRLVRLATNSGQSAATVAGVRAARREWVATMDGDGQNDPEDLSRLLAALSTARVVIGRRRKRRDPLVCRLSSRIANTIRRIVLRDRAVDTGCALKVFPRDVFLELPCFDGMHRFLPALFYDHGLEPLQVDVNHRPRRAGKSKYTVWNRALRGMLDLFGVLWLRRRKIRVRTVDD